MPKPIASSQILQDTFEKLGDQASDTATGLGDLVSRGADQKADRGIEQLSGTQDPKQQQGQQTPQGLSPQRIMENRAKEKREFEFHQQRVKEWEEHGKKLKEEEEAKRKKEEEEAQQRREQEIVQLREEEAKASVLQPPPKPKGGRGTAFLPPQAKASRGTGELSKTPTN